MIEVTSSNSLTAKVGIADPSSNETKTPVKRMTEQKIAKETEIKAENQYKEPVRDV